MPEMSESDWDEMTSANLKSVFLCTKAVGKVMVEQNKGNIINIGSVAGMQPSPGQVLYGASKAVAMHRPRSLAVEWAPHHIRVNAIAPGDIATPGGGEFCRSLSPEARKKHRSGIPIGRYGTPEDIAAAAIYLASDASDFVTGAIIVVHGGGLPAMTV